MKRRFRKKSFLVGLLSLAIILFVFVFLLQETKTEETGDDIMIEQTIQVFSPQPDDLVTFPLEISGQASEDWYEEGQFAIRLLSEIGTVLDNSIATATGPVNEGRMIPFTATIDEVAIQEWEFGTLMFLKSDPFQFSSKDQVVFPVQFEKSE